jgi:hypothetical protein
MRDSPLVTGSSPRTAAERKGDVLAKLEQSHVDGWVASASAKGIAHLVPLSLAWHGERIIVCVDPRSVTARNIAASRQARVALGGTRDVVVIDVALDEVVAVTNGAYAVADAFAAQADWDPRWSIDLPGSETGSYEFLCLLPRRIQAWREVDEHPGRTLMRAGRWLV